jgi:hypothetical protein
MPSHACLHMSSPIMPSHVFTDHAFTCLHRSCLHMSSPIMPSHVFTDHAFTCLHRSCLHMSSPIMPSHVFTDHAFTCLHRSCLHMPSIMPSHAFDHAFTCLHRSCLHRFTDHAFTCLHRSCLHMRLHMPSHLHSIVQHTPAKPCASPSLTFSIAFYIFSIVFRFAVLTSCKPKSLPIGHDTNNTDTHTRNHKHGTQRFYLCPKLWIA